MYGKLDTPELRALVTPAQLQFRIHVFGPQGAGKTPFAKALGAAVGISVAETSEMLRRRLASLVSEIVEEEYQEHYECLLDKADGVRHALRVFGDHIRRLSPGVLIEEAAAEGVIVVGARRKCEMEAWFDAPGRGSDVLIELEGSEKDVAYELAGWRPSQRYSGAAWILPADMGADERAQIVEKLARNLREMAGL